MSSPNLRPLRRLMAALLWLPLAYACSSSDSGDMAAPLKPEIATSNHYINLNIVVSSGSEGTMRVPTADGTNPDWEDGDGREQGLDRENKVTGITFMLYPVDNDAQGINNSQGDDNKLAFVKYYPVTEADPEDCDYKEDEAVYTTGIQPLTGLDLAKNYRAIVIANRDMTDIFIANTTTVKTVCDATLDWIYTGSGMGVNASNFVMSSENDGDVIRFTNPTQNGPTADGETAIIYEPTAIHIERMAARVDFWMKNATYKTQTGTESYITPGYEYSVYKNATESTPTSSDKFVLTAVTPFNLYNNSAEEYLIKRLRDNGTIKYIVPETQTNNVIDPKTVDKSGSSSSDYNNPLDVLIGYDRNNKTLASANGYFKSTKDLYENKSNSNTTQLFPSEGIDGKDNFILCYPKENTLTESSPLYFYATGVAIEGDYYEDGWQDVEVAEGESNPKITHCIYYGFLRHRGEKSGIYQIQAETAFADNKENSFSAIDNTAMNFGVVRNNIYRISIDRITEKKDLELTIRVKKWDTFTHDIIYM